MSFYAFRLEDFMEHYTFGNEIMEGLRVVTSKISGLKRTVKIIPKDTSSYENQ